MFSLVKNRFIVTLFSLFLITTVLIGGMGGPAWAWHSPPPRYWRGPVYREAPRGHVVVSYGRERYIYHDGWYYRRGPAGLFLVAPPFGMVVPVLPLGFATMVLAGATYYEVNGIYYRQVPEGYVVVEPPAQLPPPPSVAAPPAPVAVQQVVVQSPLLNVRQGPGLEQDIITQISRGTTLNVIGNVPDWYYIEISGGGRGWVMQKFVMPVGPVPQG